MAREQVVLTWCDTHQMDDGDKVAGQPWVFTITGPDGQTHAYEIDACEVCGKPYADVLHTLREYGRAVKTRGSRAPAVSARPTDGEVKHCPADGCDYSTTTGSGLQAHVKSIHNTTIAELTGAATLACPVAACGRKFGKQQGLIAHINSAHGGDPAALATAREGNRYARTG